MPHTRRDPARPLILVVDDEPSVCRSCEKILQREGYSVRCAQSGAEALDLLERNPFDAVFCDLKMPEMAGTELLGTISRRFPSVVPVVITGYSTIASVVETMRLGAYDYLPKPFTPEEMAAAARGALERRRALLDAPAGGDGDSDPAPRGGVVAASPATREVLQLVDKVAPLPSTVLILGEPGTGKELLARAIHDRSPVGSGTFRTFDCRRPNPGLLESELFGGDGSPAGILHEGGGTLFLDEICDLSIDLQGRLLRHIHEREQALLAHGGEADAPRLIFASDRDLGRMVEEGLFRKDLYYHLYVFPIILPPLRERREDIPPLVRHFLRQHAAGTGSQPPAVTPEAMRILTQHYWPGNVRQLKGVIEWACSLCGGDPIEPRHLVGSEAEKPIPVEGRIPRDNRELVAHRKRLRRLAVADVEREFVLHALQRNGWNVSAAARDVGMQRQNFQLLMRKYDIRSHGEDGE